MSRKDIKFKSKKNKKYKKESFNSSSTLSSKNTSNNNPNNNPNNKSNIKAKVKNPQSIISLNQAHPNDITISGLDNQTSSTLIHIISALIGIFVFYFVPLLANSLNRPLTAVLLNVIPNDLLLGFFVVETEFTPYLTNIIWTPLLNVLANCTSYILIMFFDWSASSALAVNVFIWIFAIFLSLYI